MVLSLFLQNIEVGFNPICINGTRKNMIGEHVGQTSPMVTARVHEASGGVLKIALHQLDEALDPDAEEPKK